MIGHTSRMTRFGLSEHLRIAAVRAKRARRAAATRLLGSRLLRWSYGPTTVGALTMAPQDVRSRDPSFWPEVESGFLGLAGRVVDIADGSPFDVPPASPAWAEALHGFSWLRHLEAAEDPAAEHWGRDCVLDWIARLNDHPPAALSAKVRARRVISWLSASALLFDDPDGEQDAETVMRGLANEIAALQTTWRSAGEGSARLTALTALALARVVAGDDGRERDGAVMALCNEIDRQVLSDGGHVSRNPAALIDILLDWLPLKTCFDAAGQPVPFALAAGIERALGMLRYLRLGDGGIARFNGMGIADPGALATLMAYDERPVPRWSIAPESRYARLAAGDTALIADVGPPPDLDIAAAATAGALAFEMSAGTHLLIVNCGAPGAADADWRILSRASASHSTLCLAETSSAQLVRHPGLRDMADAPPLALSGAVRAEVTSSEDGVNLEASHEGYVPRLGLVHRRRLTLSRDGTGLTGCDRLEPARRGGGSDEIRYAIHFHLHPNVMTGSLSEGASTLDTRLVLGLPDGTFWAFETSGARIAIEESTFLAGSSGPRPSQQIVLRGFSTGGAEIPWSLTRLSSEAEKNHRCDTIARDTPGATGETTSLDTLRETAT